MIKLSAIEFPLALEKAKVIHANKFSQAQGGAFNLPVSSTLYTEVVFRLENSGEDIRTYIRNLDLPIYTEQAVTVILSDKRVVGFVDMQTNYYYYTTRDFARQLGFGMPFFWVWVIGIAGAVLVFFMQDRQTTTWLFCP